MNHSIHSTAFYEFLTSNFEKGGFSNDDAIAVFLPLAQTVVKIHNNGKVAHLDDLTFLMVENQKLNLSSNEKNIQNNALKINSFFKEASSAFEISEKFVQKVEMGEFYHDEISSDSVFWGELEKLTKPAYLNHYQSYELQFGHHDPLTDIFILGMILASLSLNLDFTLETHLRDFVKNRKSMVFLNPNINPALANIILGMTELNRDNRWKDLNEIIEKLKNYRDYDPENEYDLSQILSPQKTTKNQFIHEKLRNRLFDDSRRNRLLYYQPNLKFLNLTLSSVPQVLNYENIDPNSIFYWNDAISKKISNNSAISLNKFLRFEDNPYISPTLDKIRLESNKDVNEYGFSQLKLVICFLNWYNTKEHGTEKINSPLLLASTKLTKKKGVKDQFTLEFLDDEVEINPVLSNKLKELYGIKLPSSIKLSEVGIDGIYEMLRVQIESHNSGFTLEYNKKLRINLIHTQAKKTLSQYHKRTRKRTSLEDKSILSYSYTQENFQPYGLELFKYYVLSEASKLEFLIDKDIKLQHNRLQDNQTIDREFYTINEGETNPFRWEFDTCNMVLGNFNYKKMSLVRDYNQIIEQQIPNSVFTSLFQDLSQKEFKNTISYDNTFTQTYNVVTADPTQNKAVLLAESGENYIIQGPPGTGKSQTIANLVANFVAHGKKVLFVCEKRAALDVVYHRLKNQNLDELCCLIHDSQTDKKEFILNLKASFQEFSTSKSLLAETTLEREQIISSLEKELHVLKEFHDFMNTKLPEHDMSIKEIFDVLIFNKEDLNTNDLEDISNKASYQDWLSHQNSLEKLFKICHETHGNPHFSNHPFRYFNQFIFQENARLDLIMQQVESLNAHIEELIERTDHLQLPDNKLSFSELVAQLTKLKLAVSLFENNNQSLLVNKKEALNKLRSEIQRINEAEKNLKRKETEYPYWNTKFSLTDAQNAFEVLKKHENNFFNFFSSEYRAVKSRVLQQYDISKHAIKPKLSLILENLIHVLQQTSQNQQEIKALEDQYKLGAFHEMINNLTQIQEEVDERLVEFLLNQDKSVFREIKLCYDLAKKIEVSLLQNFSHVKNKSTNELEQMTLDILKIKSFFQLFANQMQDLSGLETSVFNLLQTQSVSLLKLQKLLALSTLQNHYAIHFEHKRFNMDSLHHTIQKIAALFPKLMEVNGRFIQEKQKNDFNALIKKSEMSVAGASIEVKNEKKTLMDGRKILENEFGKSMRFRSIRDLSTLESGKIIRELKPIWLMSPLSVSDTLPIDENYFDVVIFDEASQITLEEGLPPIYRAKQSIIVGDEMQMPPSNFFGSSSDNKDDLWFDDGSELENEYFSLDADSFLTQGARKFPSIMLGWHYRSKHESLIGFSNASFYNNQLLTIPDVKDHQNIGEDIVVVQLEDAQRNIQYIFEKPISYHYIKNGVYDSRSNHLEAQYIALLVRELLLSENKQSIGIVAFSMEQQNEIESEIQDLCLTDKLFENRLEEEYKRIEDNQFVGLFVKNLENIQGDERDIIIMSTCFGYNPKGKMLMNFGPINRRGGEKRLNVIFSRAKKSMVVVSSIKYSDITNEYNDGANYFRKYLQYAELVSQGNIQAANFVLNAITSNFENPSTSTTLQEIKSNLENLGYFVAENVGQSKFKCDLAIKNNATEKEFLLGIILDEATHYAHSDVLEQYLLKPQLLEFNGWKICQVYAKDWFENKHRVLQMIQSNLKNEAFFDSSSSSLTNIESWNTQKTADLILDEKNETENMPVIESDDTINFTRMINTENGSNKFWEVACSGTELIIQYGKMGTKGQKLIKSFESEEKANQEMAVLIRQKRNKGYQDTSTF